MKKTSARAQTAVNTTPLASTKMPLPSLLSNDLNAEGAEANTHALKVNDFWTYIKVKKADLREANDIRAWASFPRVRSWAVKTDQSLSPVPSP